MLLSRILWINTAIPGGDDGRSDQRNGYPPSAVGECRLGRNKHSDGDRLVERAVAGVTSSANGPNRIAALRIIQLWV
jgi:hypothetical protein